MARWRSAGGSDDGFLGGGGCGLSAEPLSAGRLACSHCLTWRLCIQMPWYWRRPGRRLRRSCSGCHQSACMRRCRCAHSNRRQRPFRGRAAPSPTRLGPHLESPSSRIETPGPWASGPRPAPKRAHWPACVAQSSGLSTLSHATCKPPGARRP